MGQVGRRRIPPAALLLLSAPFLSPQTRAEEEPSLERLIELNSAELFGVPDVSVTTDFRVKLEFKGGRFAKLFQTKGGGGKGFISNVDEAKRMSSCQKLLDKAEDVFSCALVETGVAVSKFELADEFTVKFNAKIPAIQPGASLTVAVNQKDGKNLISTTFFQDILVLDGGRKRRKLPTNKLFLLDPAQWFDRSAEKGVPVEIQFKGNKLSISLDMNLDKKRERQKDKEKEKEKEKEKPAAEPVEVVTQDGIEKPSSGKVAFSFNKVSLLIGNLLIEGKLSRPWAEAQIAKLRKDGKLKLKPDKTEPGPGLAASDKAAPKKKKASVDEPDPEAEEDL